jgi:hypothetical protein
MNKKAKKELGATTLDSVKHGPPFGVVARTRNSVRDGRWRVEYLDG